MRRKKEGMWGRRKEKEEKEGERFKIEKGFGNILD